MKTQQLTFLNPKHREPKPYASVHASGRLVFNQDAVNYMRLKSLPSFVVATTSFERNPLRFYLIDNAISEEIDVPPPVKVFQSGRYYYVKFRNILNQLKIEKGRNKIYFDIENKPYPGLENYVVFALTMRTKVSGKASSSKRRETSDREETTQNDSPEEQ
ncbi:MAG: hypothetical protein F4065_09125 [Rhodothermaceae bacterium]|nr:hypothetical protein [Rhodothermaceae bacterium]MXZ58531.1 hypothetical protein [Rhodothermaceae bacterium]MYD67708.1 hypothetical protein [Rhodothermaceae bacterium]MYH13323.1 hypothetical protein [Rhodothermaceae bacterium]MYJ06364.1 hypothetical protein [Rhodothermaceae bacterium]